MKILKEQIVETDLALLLAGGGGGISEGVVVASDVYELGVEHLTAKYYEGKPVYRKIINFGALPSNGGKVVNHNILNIEDIVTQIGVGVGVGAPDAFTKLLLHADSIGANFIDSSLSAHTITAYGDATQSATQSKFGGKSMYFDGTGDYLSILDSADWYFGTGDFTVDFWVNVSTIPSAGDYNMLVGHTLAPADEAWWFYLNGPTSGDLRFAYSTDGTSAGRIDYSLGWTPSTATWYHLALTRSGTDITFYVDGVAQGSAHNIGANPIANSTQPLVIGSIGPYTDQFHFNGYIDELRISKGIARWTTDFTPPSTQYGEGISNIDVDSIEVSTNEVTIQTASDRSMYDGIVNIEYTKTTDVVNPDITSYQQLLDGSRLLADKTVNLNSSMTATDIQALIDAQPKNLGGYNLTFQFGDGTYTLDATLNFKYFYNGALHIYGNSADNSNSSTKSVNLNFNLLMQGLNIVRCSEFYVSYLGIVIKGDSRGIWATRSDGIVGYCYIAGDVNSGGCVLSEYSRVHVKFTTVSKTWGAFHAHTQGYLFSDSNLSTTSPAFGIVALQGGVLTKNGTQPSGSVSSQLIESGGVIR